MTRYLDDVSPFFSDPCWMYVLLAREADTAVIFRRGPTEWWRVTLWDTARDRFQPGQWFRGRLYPDKCDLSPDGQLFIYFAGKFGSRQADRGYSDTWTAVSRPPYLTALALWPIGGTYGGHGVFLDNRTVFVGHCAPVHHPDHPPGPLRLVTIPTPDLLLSRQHGWKGVLAPGATSRCSEFRKRSGDLILGREVPADYFRPSRRRTLYTLYRPSGDPIVLFEAHWADWDWRGRLVATAGGRVLAGKLTRKNQLVWRQLAAMHEELPARLEAPPWAQRW